MVARRRADKEWHELSQFKDMKDTLFYEVSYNSDEAKTEVPPPLIYWAEFTSMTCTISVDIMIKKFKEICEAEIPDVIDVQWMNAKVRQFLYLCDGTLDHESKVYRHDFIKITLKGGACYVADFAGFQFRLLDCFYSYEDYEHECIVAERTLR
jgi:hypothetical protein